jgi:hypothetical protein
MVVVVMAVSILSKGMNIAGWLETANRRLCAFPRKVFHDTDHPAVIYKAEYMPDSRHKKTTRLSDVVTAVSRSF